MHILTHTCTHTQRYVFFIIYLIAALQLWLLKYGLFSIKASIAFSFMPLSHYTVELHVENRSRRVAWSAVNWLRGNTACTTYSLGLSILRPIQCVILDLPRSSMTVKQSKWQLHRPTDRGPTPYKLTQTGETTGKYKRVQRRDKQ